MMKKWTKPGFRFRADRAIEAIRIAPLGVPDNEPWWLAIHKIIDDAEWETIEGARNRTSNTNACIAAVGAGEGVALVRQKLIDARTLALQSQKLRG